MIVILHSIYAAATEYSLHHAKMLQKLTLENKKWLYANKEDMCYSWLK